MRGVQVEGARCPDDPTAALPLLMWWAARTMTHEFCGSCITEELYRGAIGFGGVAAWPGAKMGDKPSVVRLMDAKVVVAFEKWSPTSMCVRQRRT